jgi:hypothetical protein
MQPRGEPPRSDPYALRGEEWRYSSPRKKSRTAVTMAP